MDTSLYPYLRLYHWDINKFTCVPHRYWDNLSNQRSLLNEIGKKLNISDLSGWYNINWHVLKQHGGASLLSKYNYSLSRLLSTVYPEYLFEQKELHYFITFTYTWDFTTSAACSVPYAHWRDLTNQKAFMESLAKKLDISDTSAWDKLTIRCLRENGGAGLSKRYHDSPSKLLFTLYPSYKQACQDFVIKMVRELKLSNVEDLVMHRAYPSTNNVHYL